MTTLSEIKIENLKSFENNPFIFREDTAFDMLIESIANLGVLAPIIVRSLDDGNYETISGHRRAEACKRLGIETIPCIVKELTKDEATVILVDLNLQRDEVLPSEKAHAYKMKMDALKNQGAKITYRQVGDFKIPKIILPPEQANITLGKWGMMHKNYLEHNKRGLFMLMVTKCTLWPYLADIDRQANEMYDLLIEQMKVAEGVTEELNEHNQWEWVQRINNIQQRAREIVINELIYK